MKLLKLLSASLLVFSIAACSVLSPSVSYMQTGTTAATVTEARQVVGKLVSEKDSERRALCSAVLVGPTEALTAAHCSGIENPVIIMEDGTVYKVHSVVVDSNHRDIAYLVIEGERVASVERVYAKFAKYPANIDEIALVIGYPHNLAQVVTYGHIQARVKNTDLDGSLPPYLLTEASAAPGNSGGGLFVIRDGKPYLIGIVVGMAGANHLIVAEELLFEHTQEVSALN
mgnify:FL=1